MTETPTYQIAKTLNVREQDYTSASYRVSWGSGSRRRVFDMIPGLAGFLLGSTSCMTVADWTLRLSEVLPVSRTEANEVVSELLAEELLVTKGESITAGEQQWIDIGWRDALQLTWSERDTEWKHDYSSNPKVMTMYEGTNVLPSDPPPTPRIATPNPELTLVHLPDPIYLDEPFVTSNRRRRTSYGFANSVITLEEISTILHWTLRAQWSDGVAPLRVTQSYSRGEPFVAYVAFNATPPKGAAANTIYQYDAAANYLVPINADVPNQWSDLMWGQQFPDGAPAGLFLAANWSNYLWKYRLPRSYRWVFTECGSFMQTAALVAASLGLRVWQSPALDDARVAKLIDRQEQDLFCAYFAAFGRPRHSSQ